MTTGKALNVKPYAGNPHARFDEGEVASAATPRRGTLLYKTNILTTITAMVCAAVALPSYADSIPTADNLVHRWSFNGNLNDTGSGTHQTATIQPSGSTLVTCSSTALQVAGDPANRHTGYLNLGTNLLPSDSNGVTIEIFATPKALYNWGRIFAYGTSSAASFDFTWTEAADVTRDLIILPNGYNIFNTMQPYTLNEMHHISVVLEKDGNGGTWVRWGRRDTGTGEIESQCDLSTTALNPGNYNKKTDNPLGMSRLDNWTLENFTNPQFLLGASFSGTSDIPADYHEVRIWNIALTDGQLSANAKAGPDDIPYGSNVAYDDLAAYVSTEDGKGRFINTGVIGRSGTKVEAKFRQTSSTSSWPVLLGVDGIDGNTRFHPVSFNSPAYELVFQYRSVSNSTIYNPGEYGKDLIVVSDYASDGTAHVVVTNAATGAEVANASKSDMGASLDTERPMYLFGCNGNNWLGDFFFGRCYYVKIWQTNSNGEYELVRSYVPCVKDGVAGLYDEVSQTIFYPVGEPFVYGVAGAAATATWNGADTSPSSPSNWLCYDNTSARIDNIVPSSGTAVTVDSSSPAPLVDSTIAWSTLTLGGTSGTSGAISFTSNAAATFNSLSSGSSGSGSVTMGGDAAMTVNIDTYLGQNVGANGSLYMDGYATAQFGALYVGYSGTGSMTVGDSASVTISGETAIGRYGGSSGTVTQTGGTVTTGTDGNGFNIGRDGTGTYSLSGGTLNLRQLLRVGWGGNSSGNKFNMTGGTLNLAGNVLVVGDWSKNSEFNITAGTVSGDEQWYIGGYSSNSGGSTGTGTFTQDGGDITLNNTINIGSQKGTGAYVMNGGTLAEKWWIQLGRQGKGVFVQNGGSVVLEGGTSGGNPYSWLCLAAQDTGDATFVLSNGTFSASAGIAFGEGAHGGTGYFEMSGGVVTVPTIKYVHGTATVMLNGGTLRAAADNVAFLDGLGTVTVGNITVDTTENGYALGVSNTTFLVTSGATPAITLTGSGSLDLSGAGLELTAKPSVSSLVLAKVAEGSQGTFTGVPTIDGTGFTNGCKVKVSADGKYIRLVRSGFVVIVK